MITVNPDKMLERQIALIEASYKPRFDVLKDRMATIMLADGTTQSDKTAAIQTEWVALSNQMNLEIMTVIGG